ncbi:ATP-binding protein [Calothrix sp. CCY 0018]|uniref:ATP-binding protein n=1 Tax=Calothrix sp. CCY 0018 TaxID=3103864 RepID=UPI0039C6D24C
MNQQQPVPRLDLAPKLTRPLSLWNPLDYLRLLYWSFFFPQALRWYVKTFGDGYIPLIEMNWRNGLEKLHKNVKRRELLFQGVVLTVITPVAVCLLLQNIGLPISWASVAFGVAVGVTFGVTFGVAGGVAFSVAGGVAGGVTFGIAGGVALGVALGMADPVALGVAGGAALGVAGGAALGVALGVAGVVALGVAGWLALGVAGGVAGGLAFGVAFGVAILRPESWLILLYFNLRSLQNSCLLPRITPLPLPNLSSRLQTWLLNDWEGGLYNSNELLEYTLQFSSVITAINKVINKIPENQLIWYISRLASNPYDWRIVFFASASLTANIKKEFIRGIFAVPLSILLNNFLLNNFRDKLLSYLEIDPRTDNHKRRIAAGFWYLHEKNPNKATDAFALVRSLLYGEEMYTLAFTLTLFKKTKDIKTIASIQLPTFPQENLLRPTTWETLTFLSQVVENTRVLEKSRSKYQRSSALNRALGSLTNILNHPDILPEAERGLILDIAQTWKEALLQIASEVGEITITEPVRNPYFVGSPVEGHLFVGREDIMRELKELWVKGNQLQSVVIYGHRRMGKSSILRNAANCIGEGVRLAYINLQELADADGLGDVLIGISDVVSQEVKIQAPSDNEYINFPQRTFKRYLQQVANNLGDFGLIIGLDEFEKIEDLIEAGKIPKNFMEYLRALVQKSPKIAFALAGLHTLEEMTADYFKPFFASVVPPIKVSFMTEEATAQILENPGFEDFQLGYAPEALSKIYTLTYGQPYLVQLLGFQLVRLYNDSVFEMKHKRDHIFTVSDVEAVVNNPAFFQGGRGYFDGVWGQASDGVAFQQDILKVIAPYPEGLNFSEIAQQYNATPDAVETLKQHDVIEVREGHLRIIVELFRLWVRQEWGY